MDGIVKDIHKLDVDSCPTGSLTHELRGQTGSAPPLTRDLAPELRASILRIRRFEERAALQPRPLEEAALSSVAAIVAAARSLTHHDT